MRAAFHSHRVARRARQARFVLAAAFAVLMVTFFRTQILAREQFAIQSAENRRRQVRMPAARGVIRDRAGRVLADNVPGHTIAVLPGPVDSVRAKLNMIRLMVGPDLLDNNRVTEILARYEALPYLPATVLQDAPFEIVAQLEERRAIIPGLVIQTEPKRRYPGGEAFAHLIGYVGEINESERAAGKFARLAPGALVGKRGLELVYEDELQGEDGYHLMEVDARGRLVRPADPSTTLAAEPGHDIQTTIDRSLQEYIHEMFPAGHRGAVVAMVPRTGEVLALYSSPTFDPNLFIGGIDPPLWDSIRTDPNTPLVNRAINGRYPPASPFKLAVAAMALKHDRVTLNSKMPTPCLGGMQYGNRYFRCWQRDGHGDLTLLEAITQSCDVYFYQLGLRLGLTTLLEEGWNLGFGGKTGIDLPDEQTPFFPATSAYFDERYGPRGWTSAVTLNLAIGQGEHDQTLINLVQFYAMLSGDGTAAAPFLVRSRGAARRPLTLSRRDLDGLRESLVQVVEEGTARGARLQSMRVAGKTGTAQNPHGENHGLFVGFAPADDPQIVVGIIVEHERRGGGSVAPLAVQVMVHYLFGPDAAVDLTPGALRTPADTAPAPQLLPELEDSRE